MTGTVQLNGRAYIKTPDGNPKRWTRYARALDSATRRGSAWYIGLAIHRRSGRPLGFTVFKFIDDVPRGTSRKSLLGRVL